MKVDERSYKKLTEKKGIQERMDTSHDDIEKINDSLSRGLNNIVSEIKNKELQYDNDLLHSIKSILSRPGLKTDDVVLLIKKIDQLIESMKPKKTNLEFNVFRENGKISKIIVRDI